MSPIKLPAISAVANGSVDCGSKSRSGRKSVMSIAEGRLAKFLGDI